MKIRNLLLYGLTTLLTTSMYAQDPIISNLPFNSDGLTLADGKIGKQVVRVFSSSGGFDGEKASNLLLDNTIAGNETKKWCHNGANPNVVFELIDYYDISRFVIRDCKTQENDNNISGYKISVSKNNTDWTVVSDVASGQEGVDLKDIPISVTRAKYIKFEPIIDGVFRIFKFEIYGTKTANASLLDLKYDNVVSTGKTILKYSDAYAFETPLGMIDGRKDKAESKWCFDALQKNHTYVVIDLENSYYVDKFKYFDANQVEPNNHNIKGYKVYLSNVAPDLSLITDEGDANTVWGTPVVDWNNTIDRSGENIKTDKLALSVLARYVKIEMPNDAMTESGGKKTVRCFEFEVYGKTNASDGDLISATNYGTLGKVGAIVHSVSGQTNSEERASLLFFGQDCNVNDARKWCDNVNENPWIIIELADYYNIDRISFRDGDLIENTQNIKAYRILASTTGTADTDFSVIYTGTGEDLKCIKDIKLAIPVEARYVKLIVDDRNSSAIRLYGLDIYGTYSKAVNRDVASVGKTILKFYDTIGSPWLEAPYYAIDGNLTTGPWSAWQAGDAPETKYILIDLEEEHSVNKIRLVTDEAFTGYTVLATNSTPDLSLINNTSSGGGGVTWTTLVDATGLSGGDYTNDIETPVKARYIKLEWDKARTTGQTRITEFEVYGAKTTTAIDNDLVEDTKLSVYPTLVSRGQDVIVEGEGLLQVYSIQGALLHKQNVGGSSTVSTVGLPSGSYIFHLAGVEKVAKTKVIIK